MEERERLLGAEVGRWRCPAGVAAVVGGRQVAVSLHALALDEHIVRPRAKLGLAGDRVGQEAAAKALGRGLVAERGALPVGLVALADGLAADLDALAALF